MVTEDYKDCLQYIDNYWDKVIKLPGEYKSSNGFLPIPHLYITPNDKKFTYLFYWDSYFMFRGLLGTMRAHIMKYVVDNLIFLFKKYGVIPNFNSHASTNRSQPPFLSSMIFDVYREEKNKKWFESRMGFAKIEYMDVWNDKDQSYNHRVEGYDLNKYGDRDVGYSHTAEIESGWDFTSRFYNRCSDFLPVDLNVYLYKYELDFIAESKILNQQDEAEVWKKRAKRRRDHIQQFMWNEKEGFYFDYDFVNKRQGMFWSLAGFTPLWAGLADAKQAAKMIQNLPKFETKYGLVITSEDSLPRDVIESSSLPPSYKEFFESMLKPKQWDFPHIWPPVEYLVVVGLLKYGYIDDAKRIMKKSLLGESQVFRKYGTFFEKLDGVKGDVAGSFHYPNQSGFGWTNAVFYRYSQILKTMEESGDDSIYIYPMPDNPPYELAILY